MAMHERSLMCLGQHGFHKVAYYEWGDPANDRVLICVHGLTRTGRDFDMLAEALADSYRVITVDLPGRGNSHWLPVKTDYQPPTYAADMAALIARLDVEQVDWVGTSLGGLIGMTLGAQPNTPIRKLVLVDIGPYVPKDALTRISGYVGTDPEFPDVTALEGYLREVNAPFGPLTDEQWAFLARNSARHDPKGDCWRLHYDPGIAEPFKEGFSEDVSIWPLWDMVKVPTLVVHGAESDILLKETTDEMMTRGPGAEVITVPGVGHAPTLLDAAQIRPVREWLTR